MSHPRPPLSRRTFLVTLGASTLGFTLPRTAAALPAREELLGLVRAGISRLNDAYWSPTLQIWLDRPGDDLRAHFEGRLNPPWWPSANLVETLLDFMDAAGTAEYQPALEALYTLQRDRSARRARVVAELRRRGQWSPRDEEAWQREATRIGPKATGYYTDFQNEYLDDSAWWALAWLKMYARTGDGKHLATARTIHAHMAKNWNPEKGGGILWCEDADKQRPNAITNNLFVILSARLHACTGELAQLAWAEKTLAWVQAQALFDGTGVVDAPGHHGDYWSYNQGTYLGGLTALYLATGQAHYLEDAARAAEAMLHRSGLVLPSGVLVEKLGTEGDACLFKGIFARYLRQLHAALGPSQAPLAQEIARILRASAESLLQHSQSPSRLYTAEWHQGAKDQRANFNTQVSALAALVATLSLPA